MKATNGADLMMTWENVKHFCLSGLLTNKKILKVPFREPDIYTFCVHCRYHFCKNFPCSTAFTEKCPAPSRTVAPDGERSLDQQAGSGGLAHRRLKIDLSESDSQPMHYLDRYSIVFNGEIYNYLELKKELKKAGYYFISNPTWSLLAAYDL